MWADAPCIPAPLRELRAAAAAAHTAWGQFWWMAALRRASVPPPHTQRRSTGCLRSAQLPGLISRLPAPFCGFIPVSMHPNAVTIRRPGTLWEVRAHCRVEVWVVLARFRRRKGGAAGQSRGICSSRRACREGERKHIGRPGGPGGGCGRPAGMQRAGGARGVVELRGTLVEGRSGWASRTPSPALLTWRWWAQ